MAPGRLCFANLEGVVVAFGVDGHGHKGDDLHCEADMS